MSDFGDHEPADAVDVSAPRADIEQVAVRIHEARIEVGETIARWHELTDEERARAVAVVVIVVRKLRAEGTVLG